MARENGALLLSVSVCGKGVRQTGFAEGTTDNQAIAQARAEWSSLSAEDRKHPDTWVTVEWHEFGEDGELDLDDYEVIFCIDHENEELWAEYKDALQETGESSDNFYPAQGLAKIRDKYLFPVVSTDVNEIEEVLGYLKSDNFTAILFTNCLSDRIAYLSIYPVFFSEEADNRIREVKEKGCTAFIADSEDKAKLVLAYEEALQSIGKHN